MATVIHINIPAAPTGEINLFGPYDVTDYTTWIADLKSGVGIGSILRVVRKGSKVWFEEVRS